MKKALYITAAFLLSSWMVGSGYGGPRPSMAASADVPADTQATPPAASTPETQAYDENGKPMTPEEFAKAYKARMEGKSAATQNRLEARQSRWNKDRQQEAPQEPGAAPK